MLIESSKQISWTIWFNLNATVLSAKAEKIMFVAPILLRDESEKNELLIDPDVSKITTIASLEPPFLKWDDLSNYFEIFCFIIFYPPFPVMLNFFFFRDHHYFEIFKFIKALTFSGLFDFNILFPLSSPKLSRILQDEVTEVNCHFNEFLQKYKQTYNSYNFKIP